MDFEEILTSRLKLRKVTQEKYDQIFGTCNPNEIKRLLGLNTNQELLEEERKYKAGLSTHNKKFLYFQLIELDSNVIIGWCGYHTWYVDHERAEIGYGLFKPEYKGQGLMTEAMSPILTYGFKHMNLNRIEAFIGPDNTASTKLVEKFNFVKEGHLREHYINKIKAEDSLVYSLLRKEFMK